MDEGEDWLMRPILRGALPYKALDDHAYDLFDFVFVGEALDVVDENQRRFNDRQAQAAAANRERR